MAEDLPGRIGRRQRRANEAGGRSIRQMVKLTPEESATLRILAVNQGISVPRLLVESALAKVETPSERREQLAGLFELTRLLASVANNVNQIARKANIEDEFPEEARAALASIRRLIERLNGVIDEVANPR